MKTRVVSPAEGYNSWSETYDTQPDNAVLALESRLFTRLLGRVDVEGKDVIDVGCGTGRHWSEILSHRPASLIGVDPSSGMLERLKSHHRAAQVICTEGERLRLLADASSDVVISTLALAHIHDGAGALREWSRVLRPGGAVLLTDFHVDAIRAGMKRTFQSNGKTIEIEQHENDLDRLRTWADQSGLQCLFFAEAVIDESVRSLFERDRALDKFEQHQGLHLVYGMHLSKA